MTTRQTLNWLRRYESRNVTSIEADGSWPIVWQRAQGTAVWDADGRKYLDLTAAFGVAAAGHANPAVVRAARRQMRDLLHAMGDVHPHAGKAQLARELSRLTFERWAAGKRTHARTIFCNSGFEAVEAALKTALLATGRRRVIAFRGAYHGLGYGALNATHRPLFRDPFLGQLGRFGYFAPFPGRPQEIEPAAASIRQLFRRHPVGAILVEPVQGRGGIHVPPPGLLPVLRQICDAEGALLIADEIYTGFGRTGRWFACEHWGVVPDVICLGKALTGGFPLSACVGKAEVMDAAWPPSTGEAIHTSTFLGHPVGCAMALAQIGQIGERRLVQRSARLGRALLAELSKVGSAGGPFQATARGLGLMAGLELRTPTGQPATELALRAIKTMLRRGFILLPEGPHGNVISFTPPLTITEADLHRAVTALEEVLVVTLTEMKEVLAREGIRLTRSLGQSFLHDGNQLRRIVAAAELCPSDKVLEIGPGLGPLTEPLLAQAGAVLAIEKDRRLVECLQRRFNVVASPAAATTEIGSAGGLQLLHGDALDYLQTTRRDWSGWKLVANLPYSVASPMLVELAVATNPPERLVATLQLEVVRRVAAKTGGPDYGLLALLIQLRYEPRGWFKIPPTCFYPPPEVDSACVTLQRRAAPLLAGEHVGVFTRLVRRGFSQRRKMMFKLLKAEWPAPRLEAAFERLGLSRQARAESISLQQFVQLALELGSPHS